MKFGVCIPHYGAPLSLEALRHTVQRAEALGYHSVWVGDHIITPEHLLPRIGPLFYDAFVVLSHMAAFTERVRLGTSVVVVPYRNPLVMAKMVATLDALCGGRVILGVGAGDAPDEFEALGIPTSTRGRRTDEYLRAMLTLWTQEPASFQGRFVSFKDVRFGPKPVQQPHIPIWVGGHSPAALRRAVTFGEAWHSGGMVLERMAAAAEELRRLAAEAGRTSGPAVTTRLSVRLLPPGEAAPELRRFGQGTPRQICDDLARYQELGVSLVACDFGTRLGSELVQAMETFAREVAPPLTDKE